MTRPLRIAACQYEPRVGDLEGNRRLAAEWVERAAAEGARLVVLPELASSGYVFTSEEEAERCAEDVSGSGEWTALLTELAGRHGLTVVAGIDERGDGCRHNSAVVVGGDGVLATYRKVHLFHDEQTWFRPGDSLPVVELPWGRLGVMVCYDVWFPEVARALALGGADVIAVPTNWVASFKRQVYDDRGYCQGDVMAMAAAAANGCVVACADRVGDERGTHFLGASIIVGADGWPAAGPASATEPELVIAEVDLDSVAQARRRTPRNDLLGDRRPDAYNAVPVAPRGGRSAVRP